MLTIITCKTNLMIMDGAVLTDLCNLLFLGSSELVFLMLLMAVVTLTAV